MKVELFLLKRVGKTRNWKTNANVISFQLRLQHSCIELGPNNCHVFYNSIFWGKSIQASWSSGWLHISTPKHSFSYSISQIWSINPISPKKCILVAVLWTVFAIKMSTLATPMHSFLVFSFSSGWQSWTAKVRKWRMKGKRICTQKIAGLLKNSLWKTQIYA